MAKKLNLVFFLVPNTCFVYKQINFENCQNERMRITQSRRSTSRTKRNRIFYFLFALFSVFFYVNLFLAVEINLFRRLKITKIKSWSKTTTSETLNLKIKMKFRTSNKLWRARWCANAKIHTRTHDSLLFHEIIMLRKRTALLLARPQVAVVFVISFFGMFYFIYRSNVLWHNVYQIKKRTKSMARCRRASSTSSLQSLFYISNFSSLFHSPVDFQNFQTVALEREQTEYF